MWFEYSLIERCCSVNLQLSINIKNIGMTGPVKDEGIVIFGRDVTKVPCFRNSFLYGISGGFICGLLCFMFTSRPKAATDFAVGSFGVITLTYWFQCRYKYSQTKFEMEQLKAGWEEHLLYEGTEKEKQIQSAMENDRADA